MQVSVNNSGPLERRVTVQVPEEQIHSQMKERLQAISRSARINGFRPGRAPLQVVEKRFSGQVRQEVVGEMLRKTFADAVEQEKLRPAGRPVFDPVKSDPGEGLSYTATFEVYPEVTLSPVQELKIRRPVCAIGADDVDRMIEILRRQRRTWRPVTRPAAKGDRVTIDFKATVDGHSYSGGDAEDFPVELGAGLFIASLEEGLIGRTPGDHTLDVKFPANYHRAELSGKEARFEVKIKEISEAVLPELDDAFYALFGVKEGGMEAFRAEVQRNMERERNNASRNLTKQNVMDALLAANHVELPKSLVDGEAERLLHEMRHNLQSQGVPHEHTQAMKPEAFRDQAVRRVTLGLLIGEIIQKNSLRAEESKVRAAVESIAAGYDEPAAVVKWYYEDPQRLSDIQIAVLEDQAVEWVLSQARVETQQVAFDDLMKPRQTAKEKPAA
ncbi:MAG TPA: trigger factor [Gammaproteobacteria bacterium]|nr:trigger factor [Gammaproteobacteria bacterium]